MAAFAIEDALVKRASQELPVSEVLVVFGVGGALVFWAIRLGSDTPLLHPSVFSRAMGIRFVFELLGRLSYVLAIAITPLSSATAILQATPLVVVLGGKLFFREQVNWRRWCAVAVGISGVMIVLRPAASDFAWSSLLTFMAMIGFAGRDLASRAVPSSLGVRHLGFYGFVTIAVAGVLFAVWDSDSFLLPRRESCATLGFAVAVGAGAYIALMKAMRTGDIAAVTPFRYTRLLFGIGAGCLVFHETISRHVVVGCAVILLAGFLIVWDGWRGRAA